MLQDYPAQQEQEEQARWKMTFFAKQFGLNISKLDEDELRILIKALQGSNLYKKSGRQGGRATKITVVTAYFFWYTKRGFVCPVATLLPLQSRFTAREKAKHGTTLFSKRGRLSLKKMYVLIFVIALFALLAAGCYGTDKSPSANLTENTGPDVSPAHGATVDLYSFYGSDSRSYDLMGACFALGYELINSDINHESGGVMSYTFRHTLTRDLLSFYGVINNNQFVNMGLYVRDGDKAMRYTSFMWADECSYRAIELEELDALEEMTAKGANATILVFVPDNGDEILFAEGSMENILRVLEKSVDGSRDNPFLAMSFGSYWSGSYHTVDGRLQPDDGVDETGSWSFIQDKRTHLH